MKKILLAAMIVVYAGLNTRASETISGIGLGTFAGIQGSSQIDGTHTVTGNEVSITAQLNTKLSNGTTRHEWMYGSGLIIRKLDASGKLIGQVGLIGQFSPSSSVQGKLYINYVIVNGAAKPKNLSIQGSQITANYALK